MFATPAFAEVAEESRAALRPKRQEAKDKRLPFFISIQCIFYNTDHMPNFGLAPGDVGRG